MSGSAKKSKTKFAPGVSICVVDGSHVDLASWRRPAQQVVSIPPIAVQEPSKQRKRTQPSREQNKTAGYLGFLFCEQCERHYFCKHERERERGGGG
eukprot:2464227-Rhodomonas_salina.1